MFKSKIFNSVMRYMLVAMLALLPNTIWAGEIYTNNHYCPIKKGNSIFETVEL